MHLFMDDPSVFYRATRDLFAAGDARPSLCHRFIAELERRGKLLRNYTQNVDGLEIVAGVTRLVQCHGSTRTATCVTCGHRVGMDTALPAILRGDVPTCPACAPAGTRSATECERSGVVGSDRPPKRAAAARAADSLRVTDARTLCALKPDIVFFHEPLPPAYAASLLSDVKAADAFVVVGSSLQVQPVCGVLGVLPPALPAVLLNRHTVGAPHSFDVELLGDCDATARTLAGALGWEVGEVGEAPKESPPAPSASHAPEVSR